MSSRLRASLRELGVASLLALLAFALYVVPQNPGSLTPDELAILQQASTVNGPAHLFFRVSDERWLQPVAVYATAVVSAVTPTDQAGRLAAALVGALDVVLMFLLTRRLFSQPLIPVATALLLMVTPSHFVYARSGTDAIFLLPFVLVWLIQMVDYMRDGRERRSAVAALALGLGVYTQAAAPVTMSFLLVLTVAAITASGRASLRAVAIPLAAFSLPLGLAVAWFVAHPLTYAETFGRWAIHAAHVRYPLDGVRAFVNWTTLENRASLYWGFFDPSWLFFDGPVDATTTLRGSAPLLLATLPLLILGGRWALNHASRGAAALLLGGFAVAPLAAATFGEPHAMASAMAVVPFVVVLAAGGALGVWSSGGRLGPPLLGLAVAACAVDFGWFYTSYWR